MDRKILCFAVAATLAPAHAFGLTLIDENSSGFEGIDNVNQPMNRARMNLNEIQGAWSESDPMSNVLVVQHSRNVTHKLRLREMMNTLIVLPEGEKIKGISLGDKANFVFEPVKGDGATAFENMGNVRAIYPGADTNLTLISENANVYSFYLRVDTVESEFMPDLVVYVESDEIVRENRLKQAKADMQAKQEAEEQAEQEAAEKEAEKEKEKGEYLNTRAETNAATLNFNYKQRSGDEALMPVRIMDDGVWTYFQFADDNMDGVKNLPAIYRVVDGFDTPVNSRIEGGTVVVETVSDKWTLRSGSATACVIKDN